MELTLYIPSTHQGSLEKDKFSFLSLLIQSYNGYGFRVLVIVIYPSREHKQSQLSVPPELTVSDPFLLTCNMSYQQVIRSLLFAELRNWATSLVITFWWTLAVQFLQDLNHDCRAPGLQHIILIHLRGMLNLAFACIPHKQLTCYRTEYLKCKLTMQGLLLRREKSSWEQILGGLRQNSWFFSQYTISSFLPVYPGQSPETINHLSEGITFLLLGFHFHCETFFTGILHRLFILQAERKSILLELWNQNHCGFDSWYYYLLCLWSKTVSPSSHSWGWCDTGYLW